MTKKVEVKKDRRTKADLIKSLDAVTAQRDTLMERQVRPPVMIATESENFDAGYKAGVKAQQGWYAEHPWWAFWK